MSQFSEINCPYCEHRVIPHQSAKSVLCPECGADLHLLATHVPPAPCRAGLEHAKPCGPTGDPFYCACGCSGDETWCMEDNDLLMEQGEG